MGGWENETVVKNRNYKSGKGVVESGLRLLLDDGRVSRQ